MANRVVAIDWDALEVAVERNSPDTESFLALATGQVIAVVKGDPEASTKKAQIRAHIDQYVRIEPASSREQYRWMERFVGSVVDDALRERLVIAIDGKGAFRRFKDVLLAYPAERERWFSYRSEHLRWHIHNWMQETKLQSDGLPPWGEVQEPAELVPAVAEIVAPAETPGEALRRQARELIDEIPAIDLPSAIAFLSFLRDKGREALLGEGESPTDQRRVAG